MISSVSLLTQPLGSLKWPLSSDNDQEIKKPKIESNHSNVAQHQLSEIQCRRRKKWTLWRNGCDWESLLLCSTCWRGGHIFFILHASPVPSSAHNARGVIRSSGPSLLPPLRATPRSQLTDKTSSPTIMCTLEKNSHDAPRHCDYNLDQPSPRLISIVVGRAETAPSGICSFRQKRHCSGRQVEKTAPTRAPIHFHYPTGSINEGREGRRGCTTLR